MQGALVAVNGEFDGDPVEAEVTFCHPGGLTTMHEVTIAVPSEGGAVDLFFSDGTSSHLDLNLFPPGNDSGRAVLAPVSIEEYGNLEIALGLIWDAVSSGELTEGQIAQVSAIYSLLEDTHREAEAGKTPRWKLVGPFARGLLRLAKEIPVTALGWVKLLEILVDMGWLETAARLTKLVQ